MTVGKCLEILQKLEECLSIDDLAIEYGISQRTIRRYKQQSTSIRELRENPMHLRIKIWKARLYEWFLARRALGDIVPNALLRKKAKELENEFGSSSNFKNEILNPKEIAEWITECEKEESIVQNTMGSLKEIINTELESDIEDEEIVYMFYNLEK